MIFSSLVTRTLKQTPPNCAKMHTEVEQMKPPTPTRGKIALLKAEEDMFRHRIESLPGNRPNSKCNFPLQRNLFFEFVSKFSLLFAVKTKQDSGDLKDEDTLVEIGKKMY